jgi:hypothetical protein
VTITTPDVHSYSYLIWQGLFARLKELPTFGSIVKWSDNPASRIQIADVPYFGCYFLEERTEPDGDDNAGEPDFIYHVKLGFSVFIEQNDATIATQVLDTADTAIMSYFYQMRWFRFKFSAPYDDVRIEAVRGGTRRVKYGNTSINNERPVAELQKDLTIKFRAGFPPLVTDDFLKMHVTVAPKWPYDPGAYVPGFVIRYGEEVEVEAAFTTEYNIPQN